MQMAKREDDKTTSFTTSIYYLLKDKLGLIDLWLAVCLWNQAGISVGLILF